MSRAMNNSYAYFSASRALCASLSFFFSSFLSLFLLFLNVRIMSEIMFINQIKSRNSRHKKGKFKQNLLYLTFINLFSARFFFSNRK